MGEGFYRAARATVGPVLRGLWRVKAEGLEHIPDEGAAVLAGNHLSYLDHFLTPAAVPRPVYYLSKAEHFDRPIQGWVFKNANVVPVDRDGGGKGALETARDLLDEGKLVGIYPEGTRSPDGRLYKGKTGAARLALWTGAPLIPCGILGTFEALPKQNTIPKFPKVTVRFGEPLTFDHLGPDDADDRTVLRKVTDELMVAIQALTGQTYVDDYAKRRP